MGETFEIERSGAGEGSNGRPCPACGKMMAPTDVVCIACGFDTRTGVNVPAAVASSTAEAAGKTAPASGAGEASGGAGISGAEAMHAEAAKEDAQAISPDSKPGLNVLLGIGGVAAVCALVVIAAGAPVGAGLWIVSGRVLLGLYDIAIHTGTGVVAVVLAGLLLKKPVGRLDLAAGRMLLAFSVFLLVSKIQPGALGWFGVLMMMLMGAAAYWVSLLLLFRRNVQETHTIACAHAGLYIVVWLGTSLGLVLDAAEKQLPRAPTPAPPAQVQGP
ncbi:MAG: hypothetical protein IBJ18_00625 [Phycisphaerales bacterium]|nr:hypothetical protein [Phycisphaerales bacterium]